MADLESIAQEPVFPTEEVLRAYGEALESATGAPRQALEQLANMATSHGGISSSLESMYMLGSKAVRRQLSASQARNV